MNDVERIRKRNSYKTFQSLNDFLSKNPSKEEILMRIHNLIDGSNGYGSERNSNYALESLNLLIKDMEAE